MWFNKTQKTVEAGQVNDAKEKSVDWSALAPLAVLLTAGAVILAFKRANLDEEGMLVVTTIAMSMSFGSKMDQKYMQRTAYGVVIVVIAIFAALWAKDLPW